MNKLFHGNALEFLKSLADGEADVLLADPMGDL